MSREFTLFLRAPDLEMLTIRELLEICRQRFSDAGLSWGAKASAYGHEIIDAMVRGETPVFVELENDMALRPKQFINVDHHGPTAGVDATSLEQLFRLLDLPPVTWTRWHALVAANDRGHIAAMRRIRATNEEIAKVRAADRAAQGITAVHEREAEAAIAVAKSVAGGELAIVRLPHEKTAAVVDRLAMQSSPPQNVLVLSPNAVNFFGRGDLVRALDAEFPGGWLGGDLPERGFWGHADDGERVRDFLLTRFTPGSA